RLQDRRCRAIVGHGVVSTGAPTPGCLGFSTRRLRHLQFQPHPGRHPEGRRTALPRHQTLRATFDWSYELLPESERVVLRRLSIFAGGFTLEAALAVIASADALDSNVVEGVAHLVA